MRVVLSWGETSPKSPFYERGDLPVSPVTSKLSRLESMPMENRYGPAQ